MAEHRSANAVSLIDVVSGEWFTEDICLGGDELRYDSFDDRHVWRLIV